MRLGRLAIIALLSLTPVPTAGAQGHRPISPGSFLGYRLGDPRAPSMRSVPCQSLSETVRQCEPSDSVRLLFLGDTLVAIRLRVEQHGRTASVQEAWRSRWANWTQRRFGPPDSVTLRDSTYTLAGGREVAARVLTAHWNSTASSGWRVVAATIETIELGTRPPIEAMVQLQCDWRYPQSQARCPHRR